MVPDTADIWPEPGPDECRSASSRRCQPDLRACSRVHGPHRELRRAPGSCQLREDRRGAACDASVGSPAARLGNVGAAPRARRDPEEVPATAINQSNGLCSGLATEGHRTPPSVKAHRANKPNDCGLFGGVCGSTYYVNQSGRPDSNRGPHRPERCALPGCATPRVGPL